MLPEWGVAGVVAPTKEVPTPTPIATIPPPRVRWAKEWLNADHTDDQECAGCARGIAFWAKIKNGGEWSPANPAGQDQHHFLVVES